MSVISMFDQSSSRGTPHTFVLRAERDLWADVLADRAGDLDMRPTDASIEATRMQAKYYQRVHFVASDVDVPTREADVVGVACVEMPMADNTRLADVSVVVRRDRRGEGIGSALHAAALDLAAQRQRTTVQGWTWEPPQVPEGAPALPAETGTGCVGADSPETKFLSGRGWVLGQVERISRLVLPGTAELQRARDQAFSSLHPDYELVTMAGPTPVRLHQAAAELRAAMSADVPSGEMDVQEEVWDASRVKATDDELEEAGRDQLQTLVRHIPTDELVGFTRLVRDRDVPTVAHQWDTLVLAPHRGHGLGMVMKVVNHAAVGEFWPQTRRLITGNASENSYMLAINTTLGYQPYAASGFWELRRHGSDS